MQAKFSPSVLPCQHTSFDYRVHTGSLLQNSPTLPQLKHHLLKPSYRLPFMKMQMASGKPVQARYVKDGNSCCMGQMTHLSEPGLAVLSNEINLCLSFVIPYLASQFLWDFPPKSYFCTLSVDHYCKVHEISKTLIKNAIFPQTFHAWKKAHKFLPNFPKFLKTL